MKIALCQINPTIGDLRGNARSIVDAAGEAHRMGADLAVYPEMSVTGYPPLDLLDNAAFLSDVERTVSSIASSAPGSLGLIVGAPMRNEHRVGKRLRNSALLLAGGELVDQIDKSLLPTYDVYDEYRHFEPAGRRRCMRWRGTRLGVHVCEDMWNSDEAAVFRMYDADPLADLAADGADLFINLSATPFAAGGNARRRATIEGICGRYRRSFVLVNQVGANTDLVFDGDSRVHGPDGRTVLRAASFEEAVLIWDTEQTGATAEPKRDHVADLYGALILGLRDYVRKNGVFTRAVIGLSGGIDSSVTCALAVDALGSDNVVGVAMPSRFTADASMEDARLVAGSLGVELHEIPIDAAVDAFDAMLAGAFECTARGVTEENVQARARSVTLMALSNKFDYLLLSTGNKSEAAMGYMTLYGDMSGGLAVLLDVYKTQVYDLARHINGSRARPVIPERVLQKRPSAELRPGQVDQDSLPPYERLDAILRLHVEGHLDLDAIVETTGYERALVRDVLRRVGENEYKRRQAPPGLRVSRKAFGSGRRMPVTMGWDRST